MITTTLIALLISAGLAYHVRYHRSQRTCPTSKDDRLLSPPTLWSTDDSGAAFDAMLREAVDKTIEHASAPYEIAPVSAVARYQADDLANAPHPTREQIDGMMNLYASYHIGNSKTGLLGGILGGLLPPW